MAKKNIFILGATGFLGRNLAQKLLKQGHRLLCLVRANQGISGRERLRGILGQFFPDEVLKELENTRLETFEGDITKAKLGLNDRLYARLLHETEEIWHCAALLSFDDRHQKKAEKFNVAGTYHVLELARVGRVKRFHYVSTAYVAGRRQGLVPENPLSKASGFVTVIDWMSL